MPAATVARAMFDEAHSEGWTNRAELAEAMQPAHPQDSSSARAAAALGIDRTKLQVDLLHLAEGEARGLGR